MTRDVQYHPWIRSIRQLALLLENLGFSNVRVLINGWTVLRDVFFLSLSAYLLFFTTQVNRLKKQSEES